jgi:hypothetical protein
MSTEERNALGKCSTQIHKCLCVGVFRSVASWDRPRCLLPFYYHEGVALGQQSSPFKGKSHPVPIDSPSSPCPRHFAFPHSKHESPVFGQNHVRRLQRSSKERSRVHSMCQKSSPQTGQWVILGTELLRALTSPKRQG